MRPYPVLSRSQEISYSFSTNIDWIDPHKRWSFVVLPAYHAVEKIARDPLIPLFPVGCLLSMSCKRMPERLTHALLGQSGLRERVPHGSLASALSRTRIALRAKPPAGMRNRKKPVGRHPPRTDHSHSMPLLTFGCESNSNGVGASTTISQETERSGSFNSSATQRRKAAKQSPHQRGAETQRSAFLGASVSLW